MKNCCEKPGCHVKSQHEVEGNWVAEMMQANLDGTRPPAKPMAQGFMAHTDITSENLTAQVNRRGALLERPLYASCEIRITQKAKPEDIRLLLDYDSRHRAQEKLAGKK